MFQSARIKLTIWYVIVSMTISLIFSALIYQSLMEEVIRFEETQRRRIERVLGQAEFYSTDGLPRRFSVRVPINTELIEQAKRRILLMLLALNGGILGLSGTVGYLLAGRTLQPIKRMVGEQNRFVTDASHELRTPLTSLKSAFEVYLRNEKPTLQEARELIQESIVEVDKLHALSNSLLKLSQYQHKSAYVPMRNHTLTSILRAAIKKVEPLAKQKGITIKEQWSDTTVYGDKHRLTELFVILLDNAIKYSFEQKEVMIASKHTDRFVVVSVKDHGVGISPGDLPHIFNRFYRSDSARAKNRMGGYGLGLSIAKNIVGTHNGTITAASSKEKGTVFTVKLPRSL